MKYSVYVLRSLKDQRHYVGMTKELQRRLKQHQNKQVLSTKSHAPFQLVHVEQTLDRKSARVREKYWKSGAGREKIKKMRSKREVEALADLPLGKF